MSNLRERAYDYAWAEFLALPWWQRVRLYFAKTQTEWLDAKAWEYIETTGPPL